MIGGVPGVWAEDEWRGPVCLRGVQWDHCVQWVRWGLGFVLLGLVSTFAHERLAGYPPLWIYPRCSEGTSFSLYGVE